MEILMESLAQYGPLGLWTASLLYANYQTRKDAKEEERLLQDKVIDKLERQHAMLERALDKLDLGLDKMKQKYAEDRIRELNTKTWLIINYIIISFDSSSLVCYIVIVTVENINNYLYYTVIITQNLEDVKWKIKKSLLIGIIQ